MRGQERRPGRQKSQSGPTLEGQLPRGDGSLLAGSSDYSSRKKQNGVQLFQHLEPTYLAQIYRKIKGSVRKKLEIHSNRPFPSVGHLLKQELKALSVQNLVDC